MHLNTGLFTQHRERYKVHGQAMERLLNVHFINSFRYVFTSCQRRYKYLNKTYIQFKTYSQTNIRNISIWSQINMSSSPPS